jgi:hypothetical protein
MKQRYSLLIFAFLGLAAATLTAHQTGNTPQSTPPAKAKQKANKPLAGFNVIVVEPFTVEKGEPTKDFPPGEEVNLQLGAVARLVESGMFEKVIDGTQKPSETPQPSETPEKESPRKLILSGTIISFTKGDSAARFMTWPLPVGVSKVKARFVFRDAKNNQEVYQFEKEAKFQATMSGGIATKEEQMSHVKGGLLDALMKQIKSNR